MKKVLLLGSLGTIFIHSYKRYFKSIGYQVYVANTNPSFNSKCTEFCFYAGDEKASSDLRSIAAKTNLDRSNIFWAMIEYRERQAKLSDAEYFKFKSYMESELFDLVFCFWGTTLRKEVKALSKIRKTLTKKPKLILSVNTYPVRYELPKTLSTFGRFLLKKDLPYFETFDSILCPSEKMKNLLEGLGVSKKIHITPDYLDSSFHGKNQSPKKSNSIVFLGNVNFQRRNIDDVSSIILEIASQGVNVYVQSPCNISHPNIFTFEPFSYDDISKGKLGEFISSFSASLILYNDFDNLRTSLGYPTRFALATLGNSPFILPEGVFNSLESILADLNHPGVFTFSSLSEIKTLVNKAEQLPLNIMNSELFKFDSDFKRFLED